MASEGKNLVGVDIGSTSIKVCEVQESRGRRRLTRFGYHELPPETVVEGSIFNSSAVVEGLERLFHKQRRKNVAVRASGHSVIIKKIEINLMTPEELSEQIGWYSQEHIPFDLSEVHLDYHVLRRREMDAMMDVLLVAAKREEITELTNLVKEAGLKPVVVDLDAFSLQNCHEVGYGAPELGQTVVLIHVGASLTTINVLANGTTAFTRDIANGGNAITDELQRRLSISHDEAEAYKVGGDGRGVVPREVPEVINQVVDQLASEIHRSLDFYLATSGTTVINRVYMSGGTANLQALLDAVADRVQVPVELLDPLKVAEPDRKLDPMVLAGRTAQATVAMGLALRKERERR